MVEVIESFVFLLTLIALGLLMVAPFTIIQAQSYRRVISDKVAGRGGRLVRVFPSWIFKMVGAGWWVGRRVRFEWIDEAGEFHVSECEFLHPGLESILGTGRFRWIGDVETGSQR
jgi:hypothetical protein